MATATVRHRDNYPAAKSGVGDCVEITGRFTTAGGSNPSVKSSGPWSVTHSATGQYTVTLTETCAEILSIFTQLWGATGANDDCFPILSSPSIGSASAPLSFVIETQSVAGTAADLTGPIVNFFIKYRKGSLINR